jgi:glycine/D-amino acid oxidase-like deaminating enzyme
MAIKADVAVIGAGAFGLSVALHCALAGREVVVIERDTAGSQASRRAAGLFKSVQADRLRTDLARHSIDKVLSFQDWAGVKLGVQKSGSLLIARTGEHKAILSGEAGRSRTWGVTVTETSPQDHAGYYHPTGKELAYWCPQDLYIEEPASMIEAYLAACRLHHVQVMENEPAVAICTRAGQVTGVETAHDTIATSIVVDAAGAWVRQVAEMARGPFPRCKVAVASFRHQLLITEPTTDVPVTDPVVRVTDAAVYLRPARGGLMVGGFEKDPLPVDPRLQHDSFTTDDVPLDLSVLRNLASQLGTEVPLASQAAPADHRGGLFTMTPDGRFVAGPVASLPGLWVASGCNGSGFSFSPAIGEALAAWITRQKPVTALDPARFGPLSDEQLIREGAWQYTHYYDPADA